MHVRTRILVGIAAGSLVGLVTGMWGSSGGLAAMFAGIVGIALMPLLTDWIARRSKCERSSGHLP
jgi:uncharacterized membrane protein YeaQ/YmgE (transglycosylase-associated protein family)